MTFRCNFLPHSSKTLNLIPEDNEVISGEDLRLYFRGLVCCYTFRKSKRNSEGERVYLHLHYSYPFQRLSPSSYHSTLYSPRYWRRRSINCRQNSKRVCRNGGLPVGRQWHFAFYIMYQIFGQVKARSMSKENVLCGTRLLYLCHVLRVRFCSGSVNFVRKYVIPV